MRIREDEDEEEDMGEFDQIIEAMLAEPTLSPGEPVHPVPQGGNIPQMNLAGVDGFNVASGYARQPMPDPGKPAPAEYTLSGSPECAGYEPSNPASCAPNLAGIEGMPTASYMDDNWTRNVGGDYGMSAGVDCTMKPYDLTEPGINYAYGGEFEPDPLLPDLEEYNRPMGLTLHNPIGQGDLFKPDPVLADLTAYEVPGGVDVIASHPLDPDPSVPDLQQPQLTQDVHMSTRPGDLDESAVPIMHVDPTHLMDNGAKYGTVFQDPSGMNNSRRRKSVLRDSGLHSTSDDTGDHEYR